MTCRSLAFKRNLGTAWLLISSEYEFVNQNRPVGELVQQVDQMQPRVLFNDFPRPFLRSFFMYELRVRMQQVLYDVDAQIQDLFVGKYQILTYYTSYCQMYYMILCPAFAPRKANQEGKENRIVNVMVRLWQTRSNQYVLWSSTINSRNDNQ